VHEGKIRYVGHSNFSGFQTAHAEWVARTRGFERFISAQNEYSLLKTKVETELVPALQEYGIGLLPFFPLASGLLTGKYQRGAELPEGSRLKLWGISVPDRDFDKVERLAGFAEQRGISLLDVAVGGLAARPSVASVIAGATSAEQVRANVQAGEWVPTAEDAAALREIA
jgi:aryl-alcohol dehydrogenase-like predicted oxidoreductase